MSTDPLLPDLADVPVDVPASANEEAPAEYGDDSPSSPDTEPDRPEHATGEEQAHENKERESPS